MNYFVIFGLALIAFIASMIWYMLFGKVLAKLKPEAYGDMKPNAASAGPSFQAAISRGKFHGMICPTTPTGSRTV